MTKEDQSKARSQANRNRVPQIVLDAVAKLPEPSKHIASRALRNFFELALVPMDDGGWFVQTGDIPAMWIRDSSWQLWPLLRFSTDQEISNLISKVISAQVKFLEIDPYANAFNIEPNGNCWHKDFADQSDWVFERKWELDSITAFLHLSLEFEQQSGSFAHLDTRWWQLVETLVQVLDREREHDPEEYRFWRDGAPDHDHLSNSGHGADFKPCGLIWSAFRPSDDSCELPFNIPANIHAYLTLDRLAKVAARHGRPIAAQAKELSESIRVAVELHALAEHDGISIFAYEVDGLGNQCLMDDANFPSLLSLPFLGHPVDKLYLSTREFVLSGSNPWFFIGKAARGIGSPHTGPNRVWPLAIAMQGLTASSLVEAEECELVIARTVTADNHIHESIDVNNHLDFTREWFSWAELTFVELAFRNYAARN